MRYQIIVETVKGVDSIKVRSSKFGFFWEYEVMDYGLGLNEYREFKTIESAKTFIKLKTNK